MILLLLINESAVIETIIVPALLNQFHVADMKHQSKAICALGRLGHLASRSETVPLLMDLYLNSPVDKTLVVAALRAVGEKGEKALCKLLKKTKNPKQRATICFFLGQKVPVEFADHIEITLFE